jgi:hypothetical protein
MLDAQVRLKDIKISAALGGDGGNGGFFQIGGAPGLGAPGGQGVGGSPFGCSGGDGGKGGNGGHGGGGLGGPSIAIAYSSGVLPVLEPGVDAKVEAGGKGGLGANPTLSGTAGDDGVAEKLVSFPQ